MNLFLKIPSIFLLSFFLQVPCLASAEEDAEVRSDSVSTPAVIFDYAHRIVHAALSTHLKKVLLSNSLVVFHEGSHALVAKISAGDIFAITLGVSSRGELKQIPENMLMKFPGFTLVGLLWKEGFTKCPRAARCGGFVDYLTTIAGGTGTVIFHVSAIATHQFISQLDTNRSLTEQAFEGMKKPFTLIQTQIDSTQGVPEYLAAQALNGYLYYSFVEEITYAFLPMLVKIGNKYFIYSAGDGSDAFRTLGISLEGKTALFAGYASLAIKRLSLLLIAGSILYQSCQDLPQVWAYELNYWQ